MEKNAPNGLSIALSLILGVYVAAGMAFYWICSNLMAIVVQALCNLFIRPAKYIDYAELEQSRVELEDLNSFAARKVPWYKHRSPRQAREARLRGEKKHFMNVTGKHIVFYSERSGFYRYFQGAIEWLLENSDVHIHYVTSDPERSGFLAGSGRAAHHALFHQGEEAHHAHDEARLRYRRHDARRFGELLH